MLALAHGLAQRGHRVDLVVTKGQGFFQRRRVTPRERLVDLERWWMRLPLIGWSKRARTPCQSAPALARYLRLHQPDVLLAASHYVNLAAIWGCRLAEPGPLGDYGSARISPARSSTTNFPTGRRPFLGWMARRYFREAEAILAVSNARGRRPRRKSAALPSSDDSHDL